jgi:hypothetical protein
MNVLYRSVRPDVVGQDVEDVFSQLRDGIRTQRIPPERKTARIH